MREYRIVPVFRFKGKLRGHPRFQKVVKNVKI